MDCPYVSPLEPRNAAALNLVAVSMVCSTVSPSKKNRYIESSSPKTRSYYVGSVTLKGTGGVL